MMNLSQNSIISVRYAFRHGQSEQNRHALLKLAEQLQQYHGFLHYRIVGLDDRRGEPILLTFWLSAAHYRKAARLMRQEAEQNIA
ncbi:hypothetical protein G4Y79_06335 [Phototrophicus methaneseepsis]|uniref:ABM domain-containing protein n=1 Tax=Phototrophicus methaneseepsis TaxID=2710758 RepID=A0A7S8EBR4_9CHLR|nr:hypothetical protein [Phototrophicus methaneseepsis]QPC83994.1 hypothetical protein G4Y79_06335 [Phototrophicus methaneseepsis]